VDRGTLCAFDCYLGRGIYGRPGASTVVWDVGSDHVFVIQGLMPAFFMFIRCLRVYDYIYYTCYA
jgi:hypothetical protein